VGCNLTIANIVVSICVQNTQQLEALRSDITLPPAAGAENGPPAVAPEDEHPMEHRPKGECHGVCSRVDTHRHIDLDLFLCSTLDDTFSLSARRGDGLTVRQVSVYA
jgi:hypothetical protein